MEVSSAQVVVIVSILFILVLMVLAILIGLFIVQFKFRIQALYNNYYNALIEAENNERKRLSMALHDEVNPLVNGLFLKLNAMPNKRGVDGDMMHGLVVLSDTIRQLSHQMNRGQLSFEQLVKQINWFYKALFAEQFRFEFILPNPLPLIPTSFTESIFAIVKELMSNTAKYANAQSVCLTIVYSDTVLGVRFEDNGKGFDNAAVLMRGIGMQNIQTRVIQLGGTCSFFGQSGFLFEAEWPLSVLNE